MAAAEWYEAATGVIEVDPVMLPLLFVMKHCGLVSTPLTFTNTQYPFAYTTVMAFPDELVHEHSVVVGAIVLVVHWQVDVGPIVLVLVVHWHVFVGLMVLVLVVHWHVLVGLSVLLVVELLLVVVFEVDVALSVLLLVDEVVDSVLLLVDELLLDSVLLLELLELEHCELLFGVMVLPPPAS